jgi:hypothetical protein
MLPEYQEVVRRPNIMRTRNPLKQFTSKVVGLGDRVKELNNFREWQKLIAEYRKQGIVLDPKMRPLVKMVKLGLILIDEDIQRALDVKHCTRKIAAIEYFNPQLLQVVYCVKTPGLEEYHAVDGQHTATTLAALIDAGLFSGEKDWRDVEVSVLYVETTSKAFARKAFALINGRGKKKISAWYDHRTRVLSARIDNSQDDEDKEALCKQKICEKYDCYPVDEDSTHANTTAGTFTHMQAFNLPKDTLEIACKFHNDYFHYDPIDGSLWFMIDDIVKAFGAAEIKLTDKFLEELAGILQQCFAGLAEFHSAVHRAHQRWGENYYGYTKFPWQDDAIAAVLVLLYEKLGGKQRVPKHLKDRFEKILDFVDDDVKALYEILEDKQEEMA